MERLTLAYLVVAVVGIGLAVYTANEYATQNFAACSINQQFSCSGVFRSGHTSIFGIPFYILGLVWFPLVLVAGLVTSKGGDDSLRGEILLPLLMVGNIFTIYLWYLEIAVIGIICPLCISLYFVNYALTSIVILSLI